jgi:microcystin-dependent protein
VVLVGGQFNVVLGADGGTEIAPSSVNDIGFAFTDPGRYLQMTVVSGSGISSPQILLPRQQILSTPYAVQAQSSVYAVYAVYAIHGVPPGTVVPFAGTTIPDGWELCDGASRSGTDPKYARLFGAVGTIYGGSGTTFNKPDMRGFTVVGAGAGSIGTTNLTNRVLAEKFGAETHRLTAGELPPHRHTQTINNFDPMVSVTVNQGGPYGVSSRNAAGPGVTLNIDASCADCGNTPHNNMQPSIVLNYIIKL